MNTYADTSVFVSLYINDQHSEEIRRGMASRPTLWFTPLHRTEWTHAVEQHVFRRFMSADAAEQIYALFAQDTRQRLWRETELPPGTFQTAVDLARKHAARIGTRTLDTLHVACALELKAERFWTFDERQRKLARAAGLRTS